MFIDLVLIAVLAAHAYFLFQLIQEMNDGGDFNTVRDCMRKFLTKR